MVLTSRTFTTLFGAAASTPSAMADTSATATPTQTLIRLPLSVVPHYEQRCEVTGAVVPSPNKPLFRPNLWSSDEHERFLHGLEMFPNGPWKEVAKIVGTKTTRQTMTHAQKYRQKIERRMVTKPKKLSKKALRRSALAASRGLPVYTSATPVASGIHGVADGNCDSDALLADALATFGAESACAVASPTEVYGGAFDVSFLDQEFEAMLQSLEQPISNFSAAPAFSPCSYTDELSLFSV